MDCYCNSANYYRHGFMLILQLGNIVNDTRVEINLWAGQYAFWEYRRCTLVAASATQTAAKILVTQSGVFVCVTIGSTGYVTIGSTGCGKTFVCHLIMHRRQCLHIHAGRRMQNCGVW